MNLEFGCFRNLRELEITLSQDATEEGLLAIAGRSIMKHDQVKFHMKLFLTFIASIAKRKKRNITEN